MSSKSAWSTAAASAAMKAISVSLVVLVCSSCARREIGGVDFRMEDARAFFDSNFGVIPDDMRFPQFEGEYLQEMNLIVLARSYRMPPQQGFGATTSILDIIAISVSPIGHGREIGRATIVTPTRWLPLRAFVQELHWSGRLEGAATESPVDFWMKYFPKGNDYGTDLRITDSCEYALRWTSFPEQTSAELIHIPSGHRHDITHLLPPRLETARVFDAKDDGVLLLVDADRHIRVHHVGLDGSSELREEYRSPRLSGWYGRWYERLDESRLVAREVGAKPFLPTRRWMIDRSTGKRVRVGSPRYEVVFRNVVTEEERHAILAALHALDGSTPPSEPIDLRVLVEWKGVGRVE